MKMRNALILLIIAAVIAVIAAAVYFSMNPKDTTLEFQVRDSASGSWVWDSTITLQNRTIRGYFQTDKGPLTYRFTHLKPGDYEMTVRAPSYTSLTIPVSLKRGVNILEEPVTMGAYEIPNLQKFIVFENYEGSDIVQEIRPVGIDGRAIINHPCIDLQMAAMVSVQTKGGMPVQETTEEGSERGDVLFQGKINWTWNDQPETIFRYSSRIPGSKIKRTSAPYLVIDYLILLPDPREITDEELESVFGKAAVIKDLRNLQEFLDSESRGRFTYYFFTSWNVPGGTT